MYEPGSAPKAEDACMGVFDHQAEREFLLSVMAVAAEEAVQFGCSESGSPFGTFALNEIPDDVDEGDSECFEVDFPFFFIGKGMEIVSHGQGADESQLAKIFFLARFFCFSCVYDVIVWCAWEGHHTHGIHGSFEVSSGEAVLEVDDAASSAVLRSIQHRIGVSVVRVSAEISVDEASKPTQVAWVRIVFAAKMRQVWPIVGYEGYAFNLEHFSVSSCSS